MDEATQSPGQQGFTLIELMIVISIIAVMASIISPLAIHARSTANEAAVIETLRVMATAQAVVHSSREIDSDRNYVGEYGYLSELSGASMVRRDIDGDGISDGPDTYNIRPTPISVSFGKINGEGQHLRHGYHFRMILPGANLEFVEERKGVGGKAKLDKVYASGAESYWCCYAWPANYGRSGRRAFFVNQQGQILTCNNFLTRYSGSFRVPVNYAAMRPIPGYLRMDGEAAMNRLGFDGNLWKTLR